MADVRRYVPDDVKNGAVFEDKNFAQSEPGTVIFKGVKGLTFRRCNLARAVVPEDSIIEDCNTTQRPLPPEVEPVEMVEIEKSEHEALLADREELKRLKAQAKAI